MRLITGESARLLFRKAEEPVCRISTTNSNGEDGVVCSVVARRPRSTHFRPHNRSFDGAHDCR